MFVLITALVLGIAQQAAPQPQVQEEAAKKGVLRGKAVHALTGEPVRRATVTLQTIPTPKPGSAPVFVGPPQGKSVTSGTDGSFVFEELEEGSYRLYAEKAGFVRTSYGASSPNSAGTPLKLISGGELKDLSLRMLPGATVAGMVVDEEGEPLERLQVMVLRKNPSMGRNLWQPLASAQTNERGEFRLTGLTAGSFTVLAQPARFGSLGADSPLQQGKEEFAYTATYHPGVERVEQAQTVKLAVGQELSIGQIRMVKTRVFRAKGKYLGPIPENPNEGMLMLNVREKVDSSMFAAMGFSFGRNRVNPDGSFELSGLKPGTHEVSVMKNTPAGGGMKTVGMAELTISSDNVVDFVVPELQLLAVTGRVRLEGRPDLLERMKLKGTSVQLLPPAGTPMFSGPSRGTIEEDGSFRLADVVPGRYRLNVNVFGAPTYLKVYRLNGKEQSEQEVDLRAGGEIEIVFSTNVAALSGMVEKKEEAASGMVVLERVDGRLSNLQSWFPPQAGVSQDKTFRFLSIAPGEYRAYAFEELDMNLAADAEFLKKFSARAATVKVGEGESGTVTLKQIGKAEVEEAMKQ
ncbi:MAG: carboxypeptidase regulatory-like domain-containing protein [Bryobacter sp.]|nr:carboxypeptidase regulatory-like domain-containing protein [Bryobacter sp.]